MRVPAELRRRSPLVPVGVPVELAALDEAGDPGAAAGPAGAVRRRGAVGAASASGRRPADLDDDVAELLRVGEPAEGVDGSWNAWPRPTGGWPICPAARLEVLAADRVRPRRWRSCSRDASFCGSSQARML